VGSAAQIQHKISGQVRDFVLLWAVLAFRQHRSFSIEDFSGCVEAQSLGLGAIDSTNSALNIGQGSGIRAGVGGASHGCSKPEISLGHQHITSVFRLPNHHFPMALLAHYSHRISKRHVCLKNSTFGALMEGLLFRFRSPGFFL